MDTSWVFELQSVLRVAYWGLHQMQYGGKRYIDVSERLKGASSTGNAWGILIGGFFGVLLLEFAHGTSAGYGQNAGNRGFICDTDVQAKDRSDARNRP